MIGKGLYAKLSKHAAIAALCGERVRPQRLRQQDTYPALVFTKISEQHPAHLNGTWTRAQCRYQIDCYARSQATADELAEAVRQCLHGYRGPMGSTRVVHCTLDQQADFAHEPVHGDDDAIYRVSADYMLWYETPPVVHSNLTT